jgi:lantibiotic modifying enzyme
VNAYLEGALGVERFLGGQCVETSAGLTWRRIPGGEPSHTLYHGSAGVILFYLELYRATGDDDYLGTAVAAGEELLAHVRAKIDNGEQLTIAIYSGWPGFVIVLNELFKSSRGERFRSGAVAALDQIADQSSEIGAGVGWIEDLPFSDITGITGKGEVVDLSIGAAGAGVVLLYSFREGLLDSLELATRAAERLLEIAESVDDGLRWLMLAEMPFPFTAPNFAHGPAGVGYFLADLYRETNDERYLDAAKAGARYVMSRSTAQAQGHLVCHNEGQQPPELFYLGVCHGPPGTGRFIYLMNRLTGDDGYLDWVKENFAGLLSTGAPEQRSDGLWQNLGQCCGDAGIGDYALFLFDAIGDARYLEFAERIGDYVLDAAQTEDGTSWEQAEHRNRTDFLESQTGYMQGAAGIGSFLLHLATVKQGAPSKIVLPETPFYGDA